MNSFRVLVFDRVRDEAVQTALATAAQQRNSGSGATTAAAAAVATVSTDVLSAFMNVRCYFSVFMVSVDAFVVPGRVLLSAVDVLGTWFHIFAGFLLVTVGSTFTDATND